MKFLIFQNSAVVLFPKRNRATLLSAMAFSCLCLLASQAMAGQVCDEANQRTVSLIQRLVDTENQRTQSDAFCNSAKLYTLSVSGILECAKDPELTSSERDQLTQYAIELKNNIKTSLDGARDLSSDGVHHCDLSEVEAFLN